MAENEPPESIEVEHSYLDVGPTGPRRWLLVFGAALVGLSVVAAFYGLYTINRGASPTLTPDPATLTQAAIAQIPNVDAATPSVAPTFTTTTPTPATTPIVTPTTVPSTYTVQQGDTLIGISERLNVSLDGLTALNQISGETIFPNQVLLVPPTVTPLPVGGPFPHIVSQGQTLISIAALYNVTVDEIKSLNGLTSDVIVVGQHIQIPAAGVRPPTPTPTPEPWTPAVITGDLDAVYSLARIEGNYTLHIPPDTRAAAADEIPRLARLVQTALEHSQGTLQRRFPDRLDVYVSDTLFAAPFTSRPGFSMPDADRLFLLYDGSGTTAERAYYATYSITPLVAAHTLGEAASPLLAEGLAVYAAGQALADETMALQMRAYLPLERLCAAYLQAGELPRITEPMQFEGHLGYLPQYLAAGCFVGYLIETEGRAAFSDVFLSGDFPSVYGETLAEIASDWITALREAAEDLPFDADEFVQVATATNDAYRRLWTDFEGTPAQFAAYERLDRTRMALLQGRLAASQEHLAGLEEPPQ